MSAYHSENACNALKCVRDKKKFVRACSSGRKRGSGWKCGNSAGWGSEDSVALGASVHVTREMVDA